VSIGTVNGAVAECVEKGDQLGVLAVDVTDDVVDGQEKFLVLGSLEIGVLVLGSPGIWLIESGPPDHTVSATNQARRQVQRERRTRRVSGL